MNQGIKVYKNWGLGALALHQGTHKASSKATLKCIGNTRCCYELIKLIVQMKNLPITYEPGGILGSPC